MDAEKKLNLVIYGDVAVDLLLQVEQVPQPGWDAVAQQLSLLPGGSAANCAVAAARLGGSVKFMGATGRDVFDALLRQDLAQAEVDIQHLRQLEGATSLVISIVDRTGERTFISFRGAAAVQDYGPLPASILNPGDVMHISGYALQTSHSRSLAEKLMELARAVGAAVSLDPSYTIAHDLGLGDSGIFAGLDYLFPNREEALLITHADSTEQAANRLLDCGVKNVLLKLGAEGCLVASRDQLVKVPAYPVSPVVDTTGAGDAFAGGFLAATLQGCSLLEAVEVGQAAAAIVITHLGGHTGAPNLPQLREFATHRHDKKLLKAIEKMDAN